MLILKHGLPYICSLFQFNLCLAFGQTRTTNWASYVFDTPFVQALLMENVSADCHSDHLIGLYISKTNRAFMLFSLNLSLSLSLRTRTFRIIRKIPF